MDLTPGVTAILTEQRGLATRRQLLDAGMSSSVLRRRLEREWRAPLRGVVAAFRDRPDGMQRPVAAALYAGPGCVITGPAAAAWHGVSEAAADTSVHVDIPAQRRRCDCGFVAVRRTYRLDGTPWRRGIVEIASPARAVTDAIRVAGTAERAAAIALEAVQRRIVRIDDLAHELEAGPRPGSAVVRAAIQRARTGAWSVPEAELLDIVRGSPRLPTPMANPTLRVGDGTRLPTPDLWFDDVALAVQVHSRRYHSHPDDWAATVLTDGALTEWGVLVLGVTPAQIRRDPQRVILRIERAYRSAKARVRPDVETETPRSPLALRTPLALRMPLGLRTPLALRMPLAFANAAGLENARMNERLGGHSDTNRSSNRSCSP